MRWPRRTDGDPRRLDLARLPATGQGIVEYGLRPGADGSRSFASDLCGRIARQGQGIVEYGLILSLSALFAVVVLVFFGGTLSAVLQAVGDAIDAAT
jgi:Flp pilus assembly pilin Flp